jgi:hypothetical protein
LPFDDRNKRHRLESFDKNCPNSQQAKHQTARGQNSQGMKKASKIRRAKEGAKIKKPEGREEHFQSPDKGNSFIHCSHTHMYVHNSLCPKAANDCCFGCENLYVSTS